MAVINHFLPVDCENNDLQNGAEVILSSSVADCDAVAISSPTDLSASPGDGLTSCGHDTLHIFVASRLTGGLTGVPRHMWTLRDWSRTCSREVLKA